MNKFGFEKPPLMPPPTIAAEFTITIFVLACLGLMVLGAWKLLELMGML